MIVLPDEVVPNDIVPALIDFGVVQRPPLGGKVLRVNRLGNRFRASVSLPAIRLRSGGRMARGDHFLRVTFQKYGQGEAV